MRLHYTLEFSFIKNVYIKKFRGFKNQHFMMGEHLTVIAGQNGTQKTTLLGILSQTFSLRSHPNTDYSNEKPLCGGNFISNFAEKFKLSSVYDKAGEHEWSLTMNNESTPFEISSIKRDANSIRFWKKGDRSKGSGYLQYPVIFLSLKRLFPIGEDEKLKKSDTLVLNEDEILLYQNLHKDILISLDEITSTNYLESPNKNTLGISTDYYDWKENSSGQDNVSKIILALLSFRRLKQKYSSIYKGGLLVIDELDATMYPASQYKLIDVLRKYASRLSIQVIFTTHSISMLEKICNLKSELETKDETKNQIQVLYLKKENRNIIIEENVPFEMIKDYLNVAIGEKNNFKINVFTEDDETWRIFSQLKSRKGNLKHEDITFSCSSLIDLVYRKVPSFIYPNSLVIVDGDIKNTKNNLKKIKEAKNVIVLPGLTSPERMLADMLYKLSDSDTLWTDINRTYTKQVCFRDYKIEDIDKDRGIAKKWFKQQYTEIDIKWVYKVIKKWKELNKEEFDHFLKNYIEIYNNFSKEKQNLNKIK